MQDDARSVIVDFRAGRANADACDGAVELVILNKCSLDECHPTPFPLNDKLARADEPNLSFKPSKSATASWKSTRRG